MGKTEEPNEYGDDALSKWLDETIEDKYAPMSAKRRRELVEALAKGLREQYLDADVYDVYANGTGGAVERVEAYGLVLQVDAGGRAERVEFPVGAQVAW